MERNQSTGSQSVLYQTMLPFQIKWKETVAGVSDCAFHAEQRAAYLFPEDRWKENLLPEFRDDVLDHLRCNGIEPHRFAHHVLSSQCFALNLAAPFFRRPDLLSPLFGNAGDQVFKIEAEVAGDNNYFNEPGARGSLRTSADLGVWLKRPDGEVDLALIEVKFTEKEFGICSKGKQHGSICDTDGKGILCSGGNLCPLSGSPYYRTYWQQLNTHQIFNIDKLMKSLCCPFRFGGYQLMRNQLLAAVMENDPECNIREARFVALLHDWNSDIRKFEPPVSGAATLEEGWPQLLHNPKKFEVMSARQWITTFTDHPLLASWAQSMMFRYFPSELNVYQHEAINKPANSTVWKGHRIKIFTNTRQSGSTECALMERLFPTEHKSSGEETVMQPEKGILSVRQGHKDTVRWMNSESFTEMKLLFDRVTGKGGVYFRPTDRGVVIIVLDEEASSYVSFRTEAEDQAYLLAVGSPVPAEDDLRRRYRAFAIWLAGVQRSSEEERAVIPWIRSSLSSNLLLPGMDSQWLFLNQEWRFQDENGKAKKSDVLAVQMPTGRLGIIEVKNSYSGKERALEQIRQYGSFWQRDQKELQSFFTDVLNMMGKLYDNQWAMTAQVSNEPAALFFAYPGPSGLCIEQME